MKLQAIIVLITDYRGQVVNQFSACLNQSNERPFGIQADHRTICKIPTAESKEYKAVGYWIADLVKNVVKDASTANVRCRFVQ